MSQQIDNPHLDTVCPDGYVVKIMNSKVSQNQKLLAGENEMMIFLRKRGFIVPQPVKNKNGSLMIIVQLDSKDYSVSQNNGKEMRKKRNFGISQSNNNNINNKYIYTLPVSLNGDSQDIMSSNRKILDKGFLRPLAPSPITLVFFVLILQLFRRTS